ncbi:phosphoesterase family-domain-containing protein [Leucosporidium creatinivorum]|uniref:Phosphoesterase family-domain-containing protein n=1 Tax=Leucosporidium creatinivorum TaxID=106004 RepID=A0A1Y2E5N5_9BASI|nr:phosphoesterase family-domain-containing protein [Leucosporidium creatinivorum]
MLTSATFAALSLAASAQAAAIAQSFAPPATSPTTETKNYTGASNSTLSNGPVVKGAAFDRFIQIWLENTDYATAASSPTFQNLTSRGMLMESYYGVTHPSEPNYAAAAGGDFFGMAGDAFYAFPKNASTIVDLLEAKNVSWASYQENMPYDGFTGFNYTEPNYLTGNGSYAYYVRKHNPTILFDSVASVPERALRHRNFNDFAADVNADTIPQWSFITPNLVNDAHDTTIDFTSAWLEYFLYPLLENPNFNTNRTLILLTFDETETYTVNNNIYTIALGGAVPTELIGTTDSTYYTHYSSLSTVEANWQLGSLGRQDTNKTVSNVYSFVANATGYKNNDLTSSSTDLPLTNITGTIPGPANSAYWTPILAPNVSAVGAGGGPVHLDASVDKSLTSYTPQNLTALGVANPESTDPGYNYAAGTLSMVSSTAAASSAATGTTGAIAAASASASGKTSAAVSQASIAKGLVALAAMALGLVL